MTIKSYATDIAGNRVIVKVKTDNEKGKEFYRQLEEKVDEMVEKHGHNENK